MTRAACLLLLGFSLAPVAMAQEANITNGFALVWKNGQLYLQNSTSTQVNAITATPAGGKVGRTILSNSEIPTGIPQGQQVKVYACYAPTYPYDSDTRYSAGWDTANWVCR
jgi:hypothetical protein